MKFHIPDWLRRPQLTPPPTPDPGAIAMPEPVLTHCPETGRSLEGIDCAKHAYNLWPSIDARQIPDTEAGRRYRILMAEHERRIKAKQPRKD